MTFLRNTEHRRIMWLKRQVARLLCSFPVASLVCFVTRGIVPSRGMLFDTRSSEVSDSTRAQLFWRIYESAEVRLVRDHLRDTRCLVDLGCSLGVLASVAASRMSPRSRLVCVEANPDLIELARRNIRRNAPHVRAKVIHGALDYSQDTASQVSFERGKNHTASALTEDGHPTDGFWAPALQLNELLASERIEEFSLLADIEGAEAGLLSMDGASLRNCRQIVIELHDATFAGRSVSQDDLLQQALALGFEVSASYGSVYVLQRVN